MGAIVVTDETTLPQSRKVRLYHLAQEWELSPQALISSLQSAGLEVNSPFHAVDPSEIPDLRAALERASAQPEPEPEPEAQAPAAPEPAAPTPEPAPVTKPQVEDKQPTGPAPGFAGFAKGFDKEESQKSRRRRRRKRSKPSLYSSARAEDPPAEIPLEQTRSQPRPRPSSSSPAAVPSFGKAAPAAPKAPTPTPAPQTKAPRPKPPEGDWALPSFAAKKTESAATAKSTATPLQIKATPKSESVAPQELVRQSEPAGQDGPPAASAPATHNEPSAEVPSRSTPKLKGPRPASDAAARESQRIAAAPSPPGPGRGLWTLLLAVLLLAAVATLAVLFTRG